VKGRRFFMFLVEDKYYHETLNILRGKIELSPIFKELKTFLQSQYGIIAYNFVFRKMKLNNPQKRFELYVLLATTDDYRKMFSGVNYNDVFQNEISKKFLDLANQFNFGKPKTRQDVWVCYNDFSIEMKTNINWKTIKAASKFIEKKYSSYNVWTVQCAFESSVVFFLSDEDLKNNKSIKTEIEDDYFNFLNRQDEFGLFARENFYLDFDSKQNLDKNYEGNLFYYFK